MARRLHHHLHRRLLRGLKRVQPIVGGEGTVLIGLGALVGVVTGLVAVLFVHMVGAITAFAWTGELSLDPHVVPDTTARWEYAPLIIVPLGLIAVAWFVRRLAPEAAGHGVPEVMAAVAQRQGRIKSRVGWIKMISSSVNIGLGGSLGKEGPIVQVGSAFGSSLGRYFHVRRDRMRTLVACGSAAGIAAVFNAPIGGVMFALELVVGGYELTAFSPIVIASVVGSVTAQRFLGTAASFNIPPDLREGLNLVTNWEFAAFAVLGLTAGAASVGFTRVLYLLEDLLSGWRTSFVLRALVAGLLVGGLGLLYPQVLGEGHALLTTMLQSDASVFPWTLLLTLAVVKLVATAVTIGGGGSGGVFMPALFVGAAFGGAFGQGLEALFPGQVGSWAAYALAGMAALLAGTAHAPLTGILLLFEMSGNYLLILPLMTVSVLSYVVANRMLPDSIYTLKLSRRGIIVNDRQDTALLRRLKVADAMTAPVETIPETAIFSVIVRRVLQSDQHDFPVVNAEGQLTGALSLDDLREFLREEHLSHLLLAHDCVRPITTLVPHASLLDALDAFDKGNVYELPIVARGRLVGSLRRRDVMRTYRRALLVSMPPQQRPKDTPSR